MKIAILADIHSNKYALEAVFNSISKENIQVVIVAGDLIGYYYWPSEVVDTCMKNNQFLCIRGNHEDNLIKAINDPDFMAVMIKKYGTSYRISAETLSSDQLKWLADLPYTLDLTFGSKTLHVTHGSLQSINEYIYPDANSDILQKNMSDADYTILAHTHYPFVYSFNGRWLINPGSVGQPRDCGGLASYFVIDLEVDIIIPRRVKFPIEDIIKNVDTYDGDLPYLKTVMTRT